MIVDYESYDLDTELQETRLRRLAPRRDPHMAEWWAERLDEIPNDPPNEEAILKYLASQSKSSGVTTIRQILTRLNRWWDYPARMEFEYINEEDDGDVTDFIYWHTGPEEDGGMGNSWGYTQDVLSVLSSAYEKGVKAGYLDGQNPFELALEEHTFDDDEDSGKPRRASREHLGQLLLFTRCEQLHWAIMMGLKKLKRKGEIENVDITHIHIPEQWWYDFLDECGVEMVSEVAQFDKPVIYWPSGINEGYPYNDELRRRSNKSVEGAVLEMDEEEVAATHRLVDTRPTHVDTVALLVKQSGHLTGERQDLDVLGDRFEKKVKQFSNLHPDINDCWHKEENNKTRMNVTWQFLRHWGTEWYRYMSGNDAVTQKLRGDSGSSQTGSDYVSFGGDAMTSDYHHGGNTSPDVLKKATESYLDSAPTFYSFQLPAELEEVVPHTKPAEEFEEYLDWYQNTDEKHPANYLTAN